MPDAPEGAGPTQGEAVMGRVNGKPWRCQCGANVLTKDSTTGWLTCNGCGTTYEGDAAT